MSTGSGRGRGHDSDSSVPLSDMVTKAPRAGSPPKVRGAAVATGATDPSGRRRSVVSMGTHCPATLARTGIAWVSRVLVPTG